MVFRGDESTGFSTVYHNQRLTAKATRFILHRSLKEPRLSGFLWSKDLLDHKIHQSDRLIDTGVAGEAVGMVIRFAESVVVRGKTRISAEKRINIERTVSIGNNSH